MRATLQRVNLTAIGIAGYQHVLQAYSINFLFPTKRVKRVRALRTADLVTIDTTHPGMKVRDYAEAPTTRSNTTNPATPPSSIPTNCPPSA